MGIKYNDKRDIEQNIIGNYFFFHIPRCGGTSVIGNSAHHSARNWVPIIEYLYPNINFITQVRNPFDRWESIFLYHKNRHGVKFKFNEWTQRQITPRLQGNLQSPMKPYMWITQYHFIPPNCEVHKLEDKTIWKVLGKTEVHRNKSKRLPIEWTEESRQLVRDYFKCDFKEFGYDIT